MKLINGPITEDFSCNVFWQRSFVEGDDKRLLGKIVVCASQEFLARAFKRPIAGFQIDEEVKNWFQEKSEIQFKKFNLVLISENMDVLIDIYPQTQGMLYFARSIQ